MRNARHGAARLTGTMHRRSALTALLALGLAPGRAAASGPPRQLPRRFPGVSALPWLKLATLPTGLEEQPELGHALGLGRLWVKRDDLSGTRHGGSKVRKLELLLAEAEDRGHRAVATVGGVGSNQTLATALLATERGLGVHLYLLAERPSATVRDHLLAQAALGAKQHLVGSEAQALSAMAREPERPYVIPMGGSSALGNVGFVEAGLELAAQATPDVVYLPLGTGGAAVGLALGLRAAGLDAEVIAVRTSSHATGPRLAKMARETSALLRSLAPGFPDHHQRLRLTVRDGFVGKGYAEPSAAGRRAVALARKHAGLELDLTYTGKALAALEADASKLRNRRVVFWLTYDSRRVDPGAARARDLPVSLRGYARG